MSQLKWYLYERYGHVSFNSLREVQDIIGFLSRREKDCISDAKENCQVLLIYLFFAEMTDSIFPSKLFWTKMLKLLQQVFFIDPVLTNKTSKNVRKDMMLSLLVYMPLVVSNDIITHHMIMWFLTRFWRCSRRRQCKHWKSLLPKYIFVNFTIIDTTLYLFVQYLYPIYR